MTKPLKILRTYATYVLHVARAYPYQHCAWPDPASRDSSFKTYTVKKGIDFPVPSRDVSYLTFPAGNNLIIPDQGEFGK
jgi:hypothetical protein